ncbi:MAG: Gfo/Idh/MocA family protein [Rubrobacteraceae bacterium]
MERARIGVVSFAHVHAPQYAGALSNLGDDIVEFVGVADEDANRGREAAERFGARSFESVGALAGEVDAVIVCSENRDHLRDVSAALEGGAHVLCEKPIATTVSDAEAMIRAAESAGRQLRIAFPIRFLPAARRARELVSSGAVGRVLAVNGTNHGQVPGGWFLDPERSGGGAVMDHTVHVADTLRWMLGVEATSVYAEIGSFFGADGADDAGILTLELEGGRVADGAFATIDPSWSRGSGYPTWGDFTLRITGASGVLHVDGFADHLTTFDHDAGSASWTHTGEDMNATMIRDFIQCLGDGSSETATGLDGLRALEIVLAAYDSARKQEAMPVEPRAG